MFDPDTNLTGMRIFRPVYDMGITTLAALGTLASAGAATYTAVSSGKAPKLEPKLNMPDPFVSKKREEDRLAALAPEGRAGTILDTKNEVPTYANDLLGK